MKQKKSKSKMKRTKEERETDLEPALNKIVGMGLTTDLKGVADFYNIVENFIEYGNPYNGIIKVPEIKKEFQCNLSNNKKHTITVILAVSK